MTSIKTSLIATVAAITAGAVSAPADAALKERRGTGAGVSGLVSSFRTDLGGGLNAPGPDTHKGAGRREITWDDVPNDHAAPALLNADFFNKNSKRGLVLESKNADRFVVSATAASGQPVRFADLNPTYKDRFSAFSPERLFSPTGTNEFDITFRLPGTTTPAVVTGFGAVFTDVNLLSGTRLQYFDVNDQLIADKDVVKQNNVPQKVSFEGLSDTAKARIARVHVKLGTSTLGQSQTNPTLDDVVVMDDLIYGEPRPIPAADVLPATFTSFKLTGRIVSYELQSAPSSVAYILSRKQLNGTFLPVMTERRKVRGGRNEFVIPNQSVPGSYKFEARTENEKLQVLDIRVAPITF